MRLFLSFVMAFFYLSGGQKLSAQTVVTTVFQTQEERKSTRFTLTEWLRIKERMKLMDVWLAMFSSPEKDKFRIELNLSHAKTKADLFAEGGTELGQVEGVRSKAQIFLTNLITSTIGIRSLNIDLGIEGLRSKTTEQQLANSAESQDFLPSHEYLAANFRVFGKNIQDSSLVLKAGRYTTLTGLTDQNEAEVNFSSSMRGGELQLYVTSVLGLEANYVQFELPQIAELGPTHSDDYYHDYQAFLEIAIFRFFGGKYQQQTTMLDGGALVPLTEKGYFAGLKIQL